MATAAAVLGFVAGGFSLLVGFGFSVGILRGEDDPMSYLMLLALPCAAGLFTGASWLLKRRSAGVLFGAALAAVAALLLILVVGLASTEDEDARIGVIAFTVCASVLPVLVAIFTRLPQVWGWAAAAVRPAPPR